MRLSQLTRSVLKLTVSNVGKGMLVLGGTIYFTRELGAAAIAPFFLFEALVGLISIVADFGLRGAAEKRLSEGDHPRDIFTTAILLKIPPLVLIAVAIIALSEHVNSYFRAELAPLLIIHLILTEYALFSLAAIRGSLLVEKTAILRFIRYLTWLGAGAVFVELGFGVTGVVFGSILGSATMLLGGALRTPYTVGTPSIDSARSLLLYSKHNFISHIGGYFYSWMDVLFLGFFAVQHLISAYEVAWRVSMSVMMFSNAIAFSLFPHVSELDTMEGDSTAIQETVRDMLLISLLVSIPAFFGSVIYAEEILALVFNIESSLAALVLVVLMFEKVFQSIHIVIGRTLMGMDHPDLAARATIIALLINLVLNITLIPRFGILGAAAATTISFGANMVLHWHYLSRHLTVLVPVRNILRISLTSTLMLGVLYAMDELSHVHSLLDIGIRIAVGVGIFVMFIGVQRQLREKVITILSSVGKT